MDLKAVCLCETFYTRAFIHFVIIGMDELNTCMQVDSQVFSKR
jgi:hypothetical protein